MGFVSGAVFSFAAGGAYGIHKELKKQRAAAAAAKPAAVAPHMNQQQFAGKAKGFGDIKSKLSHQFGGATAQPPAPSTPTQRPPSGRPDSYKRKT